MLSKKIMLNQNIRKFIHDQRKDAKSQNHLLRADYISAKVGRAKSWLSQVENGRLQSVKTNDLINVFCVLKNKDMNNADDRKNITDFLDDQIMLIVAEEEHGLISENGTIQRNTDFIIFQIQRGYIAHSGRGLNDTFFKLQNMTIDDIEKELPSIIDMIFFHVVEQIEKIFSDAKEFFSDEVSTRNLYLLIKTGSEIYEGYCEHYGLNHLSFSEDELDILEGKLDTNCFLKAETVLPPIDDFPVEAIDDVITNYPIEEYMMWKNKPVYIGDDPYPLLINYIPNYGDDDNYISYQNINKAVGLDEKMYLYIIKQLYRQSEELYYRCQELLNDKAEHEDEIEMLEVENTELKKQLESLKKNNSSKE